MDIRFYTLDFSDLHILPQSSENIGYTSMNTETEFCGNGSFQAIFRDEELEQFVRNHKEGLLITWGAFQGYFTDYQFKEKEKWIFGGHLNALLHKYVLPNQTISGDLQEEVKYLISTYTPFTYVVSKENFGDIEFTTEEYLNMDTFMQKLATQARIGYRLYIQNRKIYFELMKANKNPLMLSKNNANVYETQEDFSNKKVAFGGWYKKTKDEDGEELETPEWTYISTSAKSGIYKQDVVLKASSPSEAEKELSEYGANLELSCKTRNLEYEKDYRLGDIIRYQSKTETVLKQVSKISLWHEKSTYHEEPVLTEWEENNV